MKKGTPKKKAWMIILSALLALFVALAIFSICKIVQDKQQREQGQQVYEDLAQNILVVRGEDGQPVQVSMGELWEKSKHAPIKQTALSADFESLEQINNQSTAWILSDDGTINYPVVQGTDNEYYLDHLIDGTYNFNGSIFMDFRNAKDLSDKNTFIYGHNMLDGTMFASLSLYSSEGYYEEHPELLLMTPDGSYSLQVFAGSTVPGNSDVYQLNYNGDEDFLAYLEKVRAISHFSSSVEVGAADRIVTLSTCAYDYEDARYVLFCKLVPMQ